ncbi:MAG TPA: peptide ABC transporter ATP-binding protein [Lentisphaeria bacterium]|nr:MAG: hypothetical protein A2X47_11790 [Lentisphaerae bacterium GWF2_38_69]HBM15618.1 peptide ABC transporter ATP-binding protein [Lentisphaeria bacterium]
MNNKPKSKLLEVSNLSVDFISSKGSISAVDNVSFTIGRGEIAAIVGESGCGKSVTCLSLAALVDDTVSKTKGGIYLYDEKNNIKRNILSASKKELRFLRGGKIAYVFQDPSSSLNPVFKIRDQICEAILEHNPDIDDPEAKAEELLAQVGLSDPGYRLNSYPCQLSGGMQQRVMIAMALAGNPELLVADEPTTALDVTVQSQILNLLKELNLKTTMSILLVTHNLGIIAQLANKVMVMYAGHIVESAPTSMIFENSRHPYTKALLSSVPVLGRGKTKLQTIKGSVHSFDKEYKGCRFAHRCYLREQLGEKAQKCFSSVPDEFFVDESHYSRCHYCN